MKYSNQLLNSCDRIKIGEFELDVVSSTLYLDKQQIKLEPLSFDFLICLLNNNHRIVSQEELLSTVWGKRKVSDDSIRRVITKLRKAFDDNAKSPLYIKTYPLKGYRLIAQITPVEVTETKPAKKHNLLVYALATLLSFAFIGLYFSKLSAPTALTQTQPIIQQLTKMQGTAVGSDYSQKLNTVLFTLNQNTGSWQLFVKQLESGEIRQLTSDQASYFSAHFSPNAKQIAYVRRDDVGRETYLADYDPNKGLSATLNLTEKLPFHHFLSWSGDGAALYFKGRSNGTQAYVIYRFVLATKQWQQVTFTTSKLYGDTQAIESPDGRYLAIIRMVAERRFSLLILNRTDLSLLIEKPLPIAAASMVWDKDSKRLAISSFKGDFYYYNLDKDQLMKQQGSKTGLNNVFHTCGERCYFMRQHDQDYTDIKEIANPFAPAGSAATLYFESDLADFNAVYNNSGERWYFISKDGEKGYLNRWQSNQGVEKLFEFDVRHTLYNLGVNASETYLTGKLESRIFLLNLSTGVLSFISSALENVSNPSWNKNGNKVMFSRSDAGQHNLFEYDLNSSIRQQTSQNTKARIELSDGRIFMLDSQQNLYQVNEGQSKTMLVQLPQASIDNWQVLDEHLYFSFRRGDHSYITRMHLQTLAKQTELLVENSLRTNFSLHPKGHRILVTQGTQVSSQLVKVKWPVLKGVPAENIDK